MKTTHIAALLAITLTTAASFADVVPPDVWECNQLNAGDRCSNGICQPSTCSKLDYQHWDRDASAGPPTTTYACLRCGAAGQGHGGASAIVDAGVGGEPPTEGCNCSMAKQAAQTLGPWLLAAALWVPWLRRRQRRSDAAEKPTTSERR
jgi:MYXO-CTERM domain-containing protein